MRFGLFFIMPSPTGDHTRDLGEMLEQVEYAEELGYDSVWIAEHHSAYGIVGNAAVALAAVAQRTRRIRIGSSVAVLPFQNPVRVAEDYAMVDVLSGGRLNFGAGRGSIWKEYQMMSADRDHSKEIFWEAMDIVLALWNESEPVTYRGAHFQLEDVETVPRPVQRPIPTWVAAVSPDTFPKCAERGLQIMTAGVGEWDEFCTRTVGAAQTLVAGGADPNTIEFPHTMNCYVAETPERARAEYASAVWTMHELTPYSPFASVPKITKDFEYYKKMNERLLRHETGESMLDEALAKKQMMVTDPAGARRQLRELRDAVGLDHFVGATMVGGLDHELVLRSMKLFADEVMPEFRDLHASPGLVAQAAPART